MFPHGSFVQIDGAPSTFILVGGSNATSAESTMVGIPFEIPHYASMVHIVAVGAGGGGGAGLQGSGSALGGGGGGASGALMSLIIPAFFLPSRIYVANGIGGDGGTSGGSTIISAYPRQSSLGGFGTIAFAYGGGAGTAGTTVNGGQGGPVTGVMANLQTNGIAPNMNFGVYSLIESVTGSSGGFNSNGIEATFNFLSGGSGGGALQNQSTEYIGGAINVGLGGVTTGTQPDNTQYSINPITGIASTGADGIIGRNPLYFTGGIGGKAYAGGRGGPGGAGAPGCGGGGSGASGTAGGSSALGGRGGDGFTIISYW